MDLYLQMIVTLCKGEGEGPWVMARSKEAQRLGCKCWRDKDSSLGAQGREDLWRVEVMMDSISIAPPSVVLYSERK